MQRVSRVALHILVLALAFVAPTTALAEEDSYFATSQIANWAFIQSVGGIQVGTPTPSAGGNWSLPVVCDVSGLTTITQKPTAMNSSLVVTKVLYDVRGQELRISVVVNNPLSSSRTSKCTGVTIAGVGKGSYKVLYIEPNNSLHLIGSVTFN